MRRFFIASAAVHLGLLVVLLFVPNLGMPKPLGLDVYAVELVQLPPETTAAEEAEPEQLEEPEPEPEQTVEEPEPDPIPEEPVRKPRKVVVKPPPREPTKSLEERIAERMKSKDADRAPDPAPAQREEQPQPTTGTATVTAGEIADYYLTMLQGKITRNWKQPSARFSGGDELTVRVSFRILKDGSVTGLNVVRSSGWSTVDQSALEAVRTSAPFGEFPPTHTSNRLDVMIDFTVRPD